MTEIHISGPTGREGNQQKRAPQFITPQWKPDWNSLNDLQVSSFQPPFFPPTSFFTLVDFYHSSLSLIITSFRKSPLDLLVLIVLCFILTKWSSTLATEEEHLSMFKNLQMPEFQYRFSHMAALGYLEILISVPDIFTLQTRLSITDLFNYITVKLSA